MWLGTTLGIFETEFLLSRYEVIRPMIYYLYEPEAKRKNFPERSEIDIQDSSLMPQYLSSLMGKLLLRLVQAEQCT
jgi:hypothetical protein